MESTKFTKVTCVEILLEILKNRFPRSTNVYNMALMYPKFKEDVTFYGLGEIGMELWIVVNYNRDDLGQTVLISAPDIPFAKISQEKIQEYFINSEIIDWTKKYEFSAISRDISQVFIDISQKIMGNSTLILPDYIYYMEIDQAANYMIPEKVTSEDAEVRTLNTREGIEFLLQTWKYAVPSTERYITKILERNPSFGIYSKNGEIMSSVLLAGIGFMGMLYTLPEHRKRGFGKICIQQLMKTLGENGFVPCTSVDVQNHVSRTFQLNAGLKKGTLVDYVLYNPQVWN